MSAVIINPTGTAASNISELKSTPFWDALSGWNNVRRWRGERSRLQIQADALVGTAGVRRVQIDEETPPFGLLTVTYGGDGSYVGGSGQSELITTWSVEPIENRWDLWELPGVQAEFRVMISPAPNDYSRKAFDRMRIKRLIEGLQRGDSVVITKYDGNDIAEEVTIPHILSEVQSLGMNPTVFGGLIDSLSRGVTSFPFSTVALRRVDKAPPNASLSVSLTGVGKILTSGTLTSQQSIPGTLRFNLPTNGYWIVKSPKLSQQSTGYWEIIREWWWIEEALQFIYGTPT